MINASSARKETQLERYDQFELGEVKIESAIKKAIKQGNFYVTVDGWIKPELQERLLGLGYKISKGKHYNEIYTCIKWD